MKRLLILVALGTALAGCATTQTAQTDTGGYASPEMQAKEQKRRSDLERSQAESAREFATPKGLWWTP
jgi:uncharacterized lipoprotein YajG